ncbi:MAG: hypothetical protein KBD16_02665 [Candidatus Pacebacteria bacterium]|nr:hypothetical protein [Candidatus Paceibacterota bacterium]
MNKISETNEHLAPIFQEVLPALTNGGVKYFVFGGVGIAGLAGKFFRENEDVDVYVAEEDFSKTESILRTLCEEHGDWDADGWTLLYSRLKTTRRPKLDLYIKGVQLFSVVPVYRTSQGVEFRVLRAFVLPENALNQKPRSISGLEFFSPPDDILQLLLKNLLESYTERKKPVEEYTKYLLDARMVLPEEELHKYMTTA